MPEMNSGQNYDSSSDGYDNFNVSSSTVAAETGAETAFDCGHVLPADISDLDAPWCTQGTQSASNAHSLHHESWASQFGGDPSSTSFHPYGGLLNHHPPHQTSFPESFSHHASSYLYPPPPLPSSGYTNDFKVLGIDLENLMDSDNGYEVTPPTPTIKTENISEPNTPVTLTSASTTPWHCISQDSSEEGNVVLCYLWQRTEGPRLILYSL